MLSFTWSPVSSSVALPCLDGGRSVFYPEEFVFSLVHVKSQRFCSFPKSIKVKVHINKRENLFVLVRFDTVG